MEEQKIDITQQIGKAIEAYAASKVSGNAELISLATKNLQTLFESVVILSPEDKALVEKEMKEKNDRIAELEARLEPVENTAIETISVLGDS